MSRPKTQEDVELARNKATLEKARLTCDTIVSCLAIFAVVGCVGIVAWAMVTITDKPAWLEVALAILGLGGGPSLLAWRMYIRLHKRALPEPPADRADVEKSL